MNLKTVATCRQSGLPYYHIGFHDQEGGTFAERLSNAFYRVFALGFTHVIAIGDDCPELSVEDLHRAARALQRGRPVLGPAQDGGVYLIGLNRELFQTQLLHDITWHSSRVCEELLLALPGEVRVLEVKYDVDSFLSREMAHSVGGFLKVIWSLIVNYLKTCLSTPQPVMVPHKEDHPDPLRGPPQA